jgi:hypothetical protein
MCSPLALPAPKSGIQRTFIHKKYFLFIDNKHTISRLMEGLNHHGKSVLITFNLE